MPRDVSAAEKAHVINLILAKNADGKPTYSQREIKKISGVSRPFIRKIAVEIGFQFPRNGIEKTGEICMCSTCGWMFHRPRSKITRARHLFCDVECKANWMRGERNPSWKSGQTMNTFSTWVKNQAEYQEWRERVLAKYNYACAITGKTDALEVHHILPKAEFLNPELVFDPDNGIVLSREAHEKVHEIIRSGCGFKEALEKLKAEYQKK